MTVAQLIDILSGYDPETRVLLEPADDSNYYLDVEWVRSKYFDTYKHNTFMGDNEREVEDKILREEDYLIDDDIPDLLDERWLGIEECIVII